MEEKGQDQAELPTNPRDGYPRLEVRFKGEERYCRRLGRIAEVERGIQNEEESFASIA